MISPIKHTLASSYQLLTATAFRIISYYFTHSKIEDDESHTGLFLSLITDPSALTIMSYTISFTLSYMPLHILTTTASIFSYHFSLSHSLIHPLIHASAYILTTAAAQLLSNAFTHSKIL